MAKMKVAKKEPTGGVAGQQGQQGQLVPEAERQRMVAEAAYFRALERGFTGGDSVDDWLVAEREIGRLLPSPEQQKEELEAYEKLRLELKRRLTEVRDTINAETIRQVFDKAAARLKEAGEYTADTVDKVAASIEKDIAGAAAKMGPRWEAFTEKSADLFGVWRDRGGMFLARAAGAVGEWLQRSGVKLGQRVYRTGEMAAPGTFECIACGERTELQTPAHLPACGHCQKMEFRRC